MKILIAEDHTLVRAGLKNLLINSGIATRVEEARDGKDAVIKAKKFDPDLFMLDYEMPNYNAIYACDIIAVKWPCKPILIVSMYQTPEYVMEAFRAGVQGIIYKEAPAEDLTKAIRTIMCGKTWFKGSVAEIIAESLSGDGETHRKDTWHKLTSRELELLKHFINGLNSQETAQRLHIAKRTVDVHKNNMFKKLGVNSTPKLISYAIQHQIVEL